MDNELIDQSEIVLSKCGRPLPPAGVSWVDRPGALLYQVNHAQNTGVTQMRKVIGDAPFSVRSMKTLVSNPIYCRVQWPDGKFLTNSLRLLDQNANVGSLRYVLGTPKLLFPGNDIVITLDDRPNGAVANVPVNILFEGVYRYARRTGEPAARCPVAGETDRYDAGANQNILAPEWALASPSYEAPAGCEDYEFTYVADTVTIDVTAPASAQIGLQVDSSYDFLCRKFWFNTTFADGAGGTWLVKPSESSGYALANDYVEAAFLHNSPLPREWRIKGGRSVIFDLSLVGTSGSGNATIQCAMTGLRRRKRA